MGQLNSANTRSNPELPDFKRLFERGPALYLALDSNLMIVGASDAYLEATMTRREDIVGRGLFEVFPDNPGDPDATGVKNLRTSLDRVRTRLVPDTMAVQKYDVRRPAAEGGGFQERYWSPVNTPVLDADGRLEYIVHRVEDVSEFVRTRQRQMDQEQLTADLRERNSMMEAEVLTRSLELKALNEQLEAVNNAKSEFLSRVSHELRTPLAAIMGFSELLGLADLDEKERHFVQLIVKASDHLSSLLNEVIDISRIETGHLAMSLGAVPVVPLVTETVELMKPLAAAHKVDFEIELAAEGDVYVSADRQRLQQVAINLLSNAIKYNRPSGKVTVSVDRPTERRARVVVTDTGFGIPASNLGKLFTPFERLDAPSRGIDGTGLGLALSRSLTEGMGGSLRVASTVGQGTSFWIELPTCQPAAVETPTVCRSGGGDTGLCPAPVGAIHRRRRDQRAADRRSHRPTALNPFDIGQPWRYRTRTGPAKSP